MAGCGGGRPARPLRAAVLSSNARPARRCRWVVGRAVCGAAGARQAQGAAVRKGEVL